MSTIEETTKAYVTKMANDPTSAWTTTTPKETPKNLLELVRAAKTKLVNSQRYDDAKDLRDIERLLMEKLGNEPVVLNDIEAIFDHLREVRMSAARAEEGVAQVEEQIKLLMGHRNASIADHQNADSRISRLSKDLAHTENMVGDQGKRIEKLEKALSEEMAKTREMDGILAGVVKRTGYMSEDKSKWPAMPAPTFINRQYSDELLKEAKELNIDPYNLAFAKYMGATVRNVPIDEITGYAPEAPAPTAPYPAPSTLINKAELVAWLDAEIVKANNMMSDAVTPVLMAEAMVATYKAVKAHIEG